MRISARPCPRAKTAGSAGGAALLRHWRAGTSFGCFRSPPPLAGEVASEAKREGAHLTASGVRGEKGPLPGLPRKRGEEERWRAATFGQCGKLFAAAVCA